jgi:hypothetical protein
MRQRFMIVAIALVIATRWLTLAALLRADPETADRFAQLLFGPARLEQSFARVFLPALSAGAPTLVAREVAWCAVAALAGLAIASLLQSHRAANPAARKAHQ